MKNKSYLYIIICLLISNLSAKNIESKPKYNPDKFKMIIDLKHESKMREKRLKMVLKLLPFCCCQKKYLIKTLFPPHSHLWRYIN